MSEPHGSGSGEERWSPDPYWPPPSGPSQEQWRQDRIFPDHRADSTPVPADRPTATGPRWTESSSRGSAWWWGWGSLVALLLLGAVLGGPSGMLSMPALFLGIP